MKPCRFRCAAHHSGARKASSIRHVVIHSTEGGTAASVAAFFATTARASTQLVVDDKGCYRCVPDLVIPWGAPGVNSTGLHIEHCGFARWTRAEWLRHERMLRLSAEHAARWCWQYGVPRRWLSVEELRVGKRGFCRHIDATRAFPTNSGHTDPGEGFPRDHYLSLVRSAYRELAAERAR